MAGQLCYANSGEVALVASTAKTILQVKAATNQRVVITKMRFFGKSAAGGTDAVVKIRMTRSTASFGTGTAATVGKENPSNPETIQTGVNTNFTVEPTSPTDGQIWWELQPQSGIIEFYPPKGEFKIPGGNSINFEATSTGTPTLLFSVDFDE